MTPSPASVDAAPVVDCDVVVIGSGPAGWTAGLYAARAGRRTVVLTGVFEPGGALTTTTLVENYPGFVDGIDGPELMAAMQAQAERFGVDVRYEHASRVELVGPVKTVTTSDATYRASAVIVATGAQHRHLEVPGESELAGRGVSYCATCDGVFFRDQDVVVVGGGDSAITEALHLASHARSVRVIVRRHVLRATPALADKLAAHSNVQVLLGSKVTEILGDERVVGVRVLTDGAEQVLAVSGVFIAVGLVPLSGLVAGVVDTDFDGYVLVGHRAGQPRETATAVPGVFVCGDVTDRTYKQAITAAASGCQGALDADAYLEGLTDRG